jgi:hypothetical protein
MSKFLFKSAKLCIRGKFTVSVGEVSRHAANL